ncbi:probable periplasmic protein Cj0093, putative [Campylobacter insulaenigrae]|uniref:hypothetical protein n=1 Tax=Campylobacter insulaenigrae TaxID=260714 RepID=UPI000F6CC68D|nr:hypothetical protein [Campylobacter insulaenigrae]MCR6590973.1 hypothetical protein [Campylobacter insulaenigrae]MCR6592246.1 hypothetical protein [Campylobacter insulaenigrae]VEJ52477.1 probable periplasmic protein Cj0093, putative [Campylobacter insulaenigrae]
MSIKKTILVLLSFVYFCFSQEIDLNKTIGEGYGQTRDKALKSAIEDALSTTQEITLEKFKFNFSGDFDIGYDKEIDLASKAVFNSYSVEELTQIDTDKFYAKVMLYKKDNSTHIKQKSLIVINTKVNNLSKNIEQEIFNTLLQDDIFKILDQNASKSYTQQILSQISQSEESKKFFNPLKADFLLIISPDITQISNEDSAEYSVNIDYGLINFTSNIIHFFSPINLTMSSTSKQSEQRAFKNIAKQIVDQITIYSQNTFLK